MSRRVDILIFPQFQLLDAAGPISVFEHASRDLGSATYRVRVIARHAGAVASSSGIEMIAAGFADSPVDTLLVAGGLGTRESAACDQTLAFVRNAAVHAGRIASVCSGAFILAAAGLLDGRRAATHWARASELARAYPRVKVEPDSIFVRDRNIWTSAGITAGIDLALALVAEDHGESVAKRVAQQLVVHYRRPGGQSQFSALLDLGHPEGRFTALLGWAREHLDEKLPVERLADRAAMSPRNFARAFTAETGATPAKAIERLRLEAARIHVEHGREPIDRVAFATGFSDPERMRRAFIRAFGQPPQALRRAARAP
ncbi:MAG: GlxA family transcriptional regulator [Alphaproteobacteria bacterium]|nr:GlxA family transcriptional regulator [Alphaproteobacteria bacterium]